MALYKKIITTIVALTLIACERKIFATAEIKPISNSGMSGTAVFTKVKKGVQLNLSLKGKRNTRVAAHIHAGNECDGVDGKKALGHWNPTEEAHGYWGKEEFHSGDLGNITIDKNGVGKHNMTDTLGRWTIGGPTRTNITNRTIIIHSEADDGITQPSGAAGARVGCGSITERK